MTTHDLLAAKWKPTSDGWSKLCVEMKKHFYLSNGKIVYLIYAMLSNDPETGTTVFAARSESTSLSEIEDVIRYHVNVILSSKYYKLTPKHKRTLYNWLYDNGRRIIPE